MESARNETAATPAESGDEASFISHVFHELSQPVSALWCALEVAAIRPPNPEEDRADLMSVYSLVERLALTLRDLQEQACQRELLPGK